MGQPKDQVPRTAKSDLKHQATLSNFTKKEHTAESRVQIRYKYKTASVSTSLKNGEKLKPKREGKDQATLHQLAVSNETVKVKEILWAVQQLKPLKSVNEGIAIAKAAKFYLRRAEERNFIPDVYIREE